MLEIIPSCCTQNDAKSISRKNHEQSNNRDREHENARSPNLDHDDTRNK